jgi:hypothetical protein
VAGIVSASSTDFQAFPQVVIELRDLYGINHLIIYTDRYKIGRHDSLKVTTTNKHERRERMPSAGIDLLTWTGNKNSKKVVQGSY